MPPTLSPRHRLNPFAPLLITLFLTGLSFITILVSFPPGNGNSASASSSSGKTTPNLARASRIPWLDGSYFLAGINYPEYKSYGGDIATVSYVNAACVWSYSNTFDYAGIDADFADMQAHGVHVLRWFLFGDGRGAPEFDSNHMVTGFDATFFDHMDQAMQIAAHHNIYIIWSLWDFLAFEPANWLCGGTDLSDAYAEADKLPPPLRDVMIEHIKQAQAAGGETPSGGQNCMVNAGGHTDIVSDTTTAVQDSFFNNALIPMLDRYANNPNIIGWEIMNEPEWVLTPNPYTGNQQPQVTHPVTVEKMRAFFQRFSTTVHAHAPNQYATVGAASLKFMGLGQDIPAGIWNGLGFDYYGVHYYGWMDNPANNGNPVALDYNNTAQQLDAPVVIGEFPANGGSAPVYLPTVRRSVTETSSLDLRYICTVYAPTDSTQCTRPYTATVEYDNPDGTAALSQTVVVPPYGGWSGVVPSGLGNFAGAARILSNGPIAAAITQTGMLSSTEQVAYTGQDRGDDMGQSIWLPRITNQGDHRSRIAVQNTGVHTATATLTYYDGAGNVVATDGLTLAPRGSVLIDPLLGGSPPSPPAGFHGSAVISGGWLLIATVYELDPLLGSDAYNGEMQGYVHDTYLPSVRNAGASGNPTLYVQNPCCDVAHDTISYYNFAGTLVATQGLTLPLYGSMTVQPQDVLPGGFDGSAIISSDNYPSAVMRSVTTNGPVSTTMLYAGTENTDQRFHFPIVHSRNGDGSGQDTTLSVQNVNSTTAITVWVMLNTNSGVSVYANHALVISPLGEWDASVSTLPGVPAGFSGTAEVLWPWPSSTGWSVGFPMLASARDIDTARSQSYAYRGFAARTNGSYVTSYLPIQILEGVYNQHWAGALSWSYYDLGAGLWGDYQAAITAFDAAHHADVNIGQSVYTPVPTPGNGGTATALAATNTPAYGNGQTATAVALTGTPQPPCSTCNITFSDVPVGSTFYTFIRCLACRGIISGYPDGTFRPNNDVTRGQIAKILANAAGFNDPPGNQSYQDVPPNSTFYDYVQRLSSRGVIGGYPCGGPNEPCVPPTNLPYFRPGANATRGQISKIAVNTAVTALGWTLLNPSISTFQDVPVGSTFFQYIETAYSHSLLNGYPCGGTVGPCIPPGNKPYFLPGRDATRGQTSKIVANAFFPDCPP